MSTASEEKEPSTPTTPANQSTLERIRLEAMAEVGNQSGPHGILLNNRGYNYGPAPTPNPALLDAEQRGY